MPQEDTLILEARLLGLAGDERCRACLRDPIDRLLAAIRSIDVSIGTNTDPESAEQIIVCHIADAAAGRTCKDGADIAACIDFLDGLIRSSQKAGIGLSAAWRRNLLDILGKPQIAALI